MSDLVDRKKIIQKDDLDFNHNFIGCRQNEKREVHFSPKVAKTEYNPKKISVLKSKRSKLISNALAVAFVLLISGSGLVYYNSPSQCEHRDEAVEADYVVNNYSAYREVENEIIGFGDLSDVEKVFALMQQTDMNYEDATNYCMDAHFFGEDPKNRLEPEHFVKIRKKWLGY
jgi:hypothetical protein